MVGYDRYRRFKDSMPILYCEKHKMEVRADFLCLEYEDKDGKKLKNVGFDKL